MSGEHGHSVTASVRAGVPVARAFAAWATPAGWDLWFTSGARMDFREGGRYATGDGDEGTYLAIRADELVRFTWENPKHGRGSVVEAVFRAEGSAACTVTVTHGGIATCEEAEDLRGAWTHILNVMKRTLEEAR